MPTELAGYLVTGLGTGCGYALVGSGLVAVYRVTRVVNFAQGAFAVVGAMCASSFLTVLPNTFERTGDFGNVECANPPIIPIGATAGTTASRCVAG